MSEEANKLANQIARQLYAMVSKVKDKDRHVNLYGQADMEKICAQKVAEKFAPVDVAQKASWELLAKK